MTLFTIITRHWKMTLITMLTLALLGLKLSNQRMVQERATLKVQLELVEQKALYWRNQTLRITKAYEAHNERAREDAQKRRDYEQKQIVLEAYIKQLEEARDDHVCLFDADTDRLRQIWDE